MAAHLLPKLQCSPWRLQLLKQMGAGSVLHENFRAGLDSCDVQARQSVHEVDLNHQLRRTLPASPPSACRSEQPHKLYRAGLNNGHDSRLMIGPGVLQIQGNSEQHISARPPVLAS